jgi:hypothetical protein
MTFRIFWIIPDYLHSKETQKIQLQCSGIKTACEKEAIIYKVYMYFTNMQLNVGNTDLFVSRNTYS